MPSKKTLSASVGAGCCAMLLAYVPQFEGTILRGYKDPIGIVTACTGHTKTAVLGKPYTKAECEALLERDLLTHADGANRCVALDRLTTGQRAAAISFAFNAGVANFCGSTFARKLKAGDPTACAELDRWIWATRPDGTRVILEGLRSRRKTERAMCEGAID